MGVYTNCEHCGRVFDTDDTYDGCTCLRCGRADVVLVSKVIGDYIKNDHPEFKLVGSIVGNITVMCTRCLAGIRFSGPLELRVNPKDYCLTILRSNLERHILGGCTAVVERVVKSVSTSGTRKIRLED